MEQAPEPGMDVQVVRAVFGAGFAGAVEVFPELAASVAGNPPAACGRWARPDGHSHLTSWLLLSRRWSSVESNNHDINQLRPRSLARDVGRVGSGI